jgi:hypothetical protein
MSDGLDRSAVGTGAWSIVVLVASGVLGFRLGMVTFPTWHVAVETAQVVAGLVAYPPDNPFYIYHTKLWTILHQPLALLLRAGVSEMALSRALSGIAGMLAFQALALTVYALSRSVFLALGAPFLVLVARATDFGVVYPVVLMGSDHTYGIVGLSWCLLTLALFGTGFVRSGALLLGLAPAIHPSLGAWLWMVVVAGLAWERRSIGPTLRRAAPFVLAGLGVTFASLAVQVFVTFDVPQVDPGTTGQYLEAFEAFWDGHRRSVAWRADGVLLNVGALGLSLLWATAWLHSVPAAGLRLLRMVALASGLGLLAATLTWIPPGSAPSMLTILIPGRWLNVGVVFFPAVLIGLLGACRHRLAARFALVALTLGLLFNRSSMLWERPPRWLATTLHSDTMLILSGAAVVVVVLQLLAPRVDPRQTTTWRGMLGTGAATMALAGVLVWSALIAWNRPPLPALEDRTNNALFLLASEEHEGVIATSGPTRLVQLATRRPVLLDGGSLDMLPYAPEGGPAMAAILRDVYEIDLVHPPAGMPPGLGVIPDYFNKEVWERFPRQRWQAIRRTWGVTQVLTRADYDLDLPIAAQLRNYRLYTIPE